MEKAKFSLNITYTSPRTYQQAKDKNELAEFWKEKLNTPERAALGFKPYTTQRLNYMMKHLDLNDCKLYFGSCLGAKNFGSWFSTHLKVK